MMKIVTIFIFSIFFIAIFISSVCFHMISSSNSFSLLPFVPEPHNQTHKEATLKKFSSGICGGCHYHIPDYTLVSEKTPYSMCHFFNNKVLIPLLVMHVAFLKFKFQI